MPGDNGSEKKSLPAVKIEKIFFSGNTIYTDQLLPPECLSEFSIATSGSITQLSYLPDGRISASYALSGQMDTGQEITISGDTGIDPALAGPNASLTGKIPYIPTQYLEELKNEGINTGSAKASFSIEINEGILDERKSYIIFTFSDIEYTGEIARNIPHILRSMPEIAVRVPLSGSLASPHINLKKAFREKLLAIIPGGNGIREAAGEFLPSQR